MLNKDKGINIAHKLIECARNHTTIFYSELMCDESIRTSRRYIGKYLEYQYSLPFHLYVGCLQIFSVALCLIHSCIPS